MTIIDYATAMEAVIGAAALAVRGNMLKPEAKGWTTSRTASLITLGLSIFLVMIAMDVWNRGHATIREMMMCAAFALSSVGMMIHLLYQHEPPETSA